MKRIFLLLPMVLSINFLWGKLVLEIETDKPEYILYEPILLKVTLRNDGDTLEKVIPYLDPQIGLCRYFITTPRGAKVEYQPIFVASVLFLEKELMPSESVEEYIKIWYGNDGFYFPQKGWYQVKAYFNDMPNRNLMQSQEITVSIIEPVTAIDKELMSHFSNEIQARFLYFGGGRTSYWAEQNLNTMFDKYKGKKSAYLEYGKYALAYYYSDQRYHHKKPILKPAKLEQTTKLLNEMKDTVPSKSFQEKAYLQLHRAYRKMKKDTEAKKVRDLYRKRFKKGVYLKKMEENRDAEY